MLTIRNLIKSLVRGLGLRRSRQPIVVIQLPPYALRRP